MTDHTLWNGLFVEVRRRRIGGGPKTIGAEEITWRGRWRSPAGVRVVEAVSRVRLNDPMESFYTSAGHRLRDSKVGDAGHWVDIRVTSPISDAELARVASAAAAADAREVRVTRGRHPPLSCHDGRL